MATRYEYLDVGDTDAGYFRENDWAGQTFTPSISHTITSVKLKLVKSGTPTGNITVSIRATSGGLPVGADLCSGILDAGLLTSTPTWFEITFGAGTLLSASTMYAIIFRFPSGSGGNMAGWRYTTPSGYIGGTIVDSYDAGVNWNLLTDYDFMFEDWGNPVGLTFAQTAIIG